MIAFSIAAVLGVPLGLELAHRGSWHTPFIATGALALVASILAWIVLPPMRAHLERIASQPGLSRSTGEIVGRALA